MRLAWSGAWMGRGPRGGVDDDANLSRVATYSVQGDQVSATKGREVIAVEPGGVVLLAVQVRGPTTAAQEGSNIGQRRVRPGRCDRSLTVQEGTDADPSRRVVRLEQGHGAHTDACEPAHP